MCKSLNDSKYTKPDSDEEALAYSLMPGVSSKAWRNKKKRSAHKGIWDNSGYGLFFAHQLFRKLGHFYIASGDSSLFLDESRMLNLPCSVEGTVVSMRMHLGDESRIISAKNSMSKVAAEVKARLVKSLDYKSVIGFLSLHFPSN